MSPLSQSRVRRPISKSAPLHVTVLWSYCPFQKKGAYSDADQNYLSDREPIMRRCHSLKSISAGVLLALASATVSANPLDPTVVSGQASFASTGNTLTVTNTPGAIINWQGFSIGASEITRFAQQSATSAVLNRVISNNPSSILGTLQSNGRVFLINPNGIVFGAGSVVDVAGLVASTLSLSDADFLAGRNSFTQVPGAANISNAGDISAQDGGQIFLIAPDVENTGVITAPNGEILLAAGHSVDLVSTSDPDLRVNITAPAGDATNVGQLIASSGSLGLFGTVVRNSGAVSADSATMQGGKIVFRASLRAEIGGTVSANGTSGGSVDIAAAHSLDPNAPGVVIHTGSVQANGAAGAGGSVSIGADSILSTAAINADGTTTGGLINVQATNRALSTASAQYTANSTQGQGGDILVSANVSNYTSGSYSATGMTGGNLTFAGNEIKLAGAQLDASGMYDGGTIHVGGLMHGAAGFSAQGFALANATNVLTNSASTFKADGGIPSPTGGGLGWGNGGEIVLWSDQAMRFKGSISAKGGALGGNGGMAEVSGLTSLGFGGLADLSATNGLNGTLLLDPRNITIVPGAGGLTSVASPSVLELIDFTPGAGEGFGGSMTELANGNIVIASFNDSFAATSAGAVYMYTPDGILLTTLTGIAANDNVGSGGITQLAINGNFLAINSNFVVNSPNWGAGVSNITPLGAVTWGSGTAGVSGSVSSANSVVGAIADDRIGSGYSGSPVVALSNGNYAVASAFWNGQMGAVTWVDGTTGRVSDYAANSNTNIISSTNSLVGGTPFDYVGWKVIALPGNGNYVVGGATLATTPTATWVDGSTGRVSNYAANGNTNVVSAANSLMGASDPYALTNGNYAVASGYYAGGGSQRGVVTWMDGTTGLASDGTRIISATNSIIGQTNNDMIGQNGVIALPNGNYVIANFGWSSNTGAVTWVDGSTGATSNASNIISQSNSVIGNSTGEQVGARVVVLTNGNYVIGSYNWRGTEAGFRTATGAATWVDGLTGLTSNGQGLISQNNSLLGFNTSDMVGYNITALSNGNYVVGSPFCDNGAITNAGAVTWGNGLGGTVTSSVGFVSATNSLVGSVANDYVGASGFGGGNTMFALANGNYVVGSAYWNVGEAGAVTWGDGATTGTRLTGTISSANSILGAAGQYLGYATILSNGNYVVGNVSWNSYRGAATWVDGSTGQVSDYATNGNTNVVSAANSLVGSQANDYVGGIAPLSNGNYVVVSAYWDNGTVVDAGAVTWGDGTTAGNRLVGAVSAANSLVGSTAYDQVGNGGITELGNFNYAVSSYLWNNGAATAAGAVTWSNSLGTTVGAVSAANSLVGSAANENLGSYVVALKQGANLGNAYVDSFNATSGPFALAGRAFILGAPVTGTPATDTTFANAPATDVTIGAGNIAATLDTGTSVVLQANNDIVQEAGAGITATGSGNLTMQAGRSVILKDAINISGTLNIIANDPNAVAVNRSAGTAVVDARLATLTASAINLGNSGGDILLNAITASGAVTFNASGSTILSGTNNFTSLVDVQGGGLGTAAASITTISGTVRLADNVWLNSGTVNFDLAGNLLLDGSGLAATIFTNQVGGVVNLNGSSIAPIQWATVATNKYFNNDGTLNKDFLSEPFQTLDPVFSNTGTVKVQGGTLSVPTFATNDGIISIAAGSTFSTGSFTNSYYWNSQIWVTGVLEGAGTIDVGAGTITNDGIIAPGIAGGDTTDTLTITGDLVMGLYGGQLNFDLNSTAPGNYDVLNVAGTADLTYAAISLNGFGDVGTYQVLTASSLTGTGFANINSGYFTQTPTYDTAGAPNSLTLNVTGNVLANAIFWDGGAGTFNWGDALNWSSDALPTAPDNIYIGPLTNNPVSISAGARLGNNMVCEADFLLSGGDLTLGGVSYFNGVTGMSGGTLSTAGATAMATLNWTGGTITGAGVLTTGSLNLVYGYTQVLDGKTLDTNGTTTLTYNDLHLVNGAIVNNNGTWTIDGSNITVGAGGGTFNNHGRFEIPLYAGYSTIYSVFNNDDASFLDGLNGVYVNSGGLTLAGGGTSDYAGFDAPFTIMAGTALRIQNGYTFANATTDIGLGSLELVGGTVNTAGVLRANDITVSGPVSSDGDLTLVTNTFINSSGSATPFTITGRWLIFSADPLLNTLGGITPDFKRYNCTEYFGGCFSSVNIPGTGNGLLYTIAPTLTVTADVSGKMYGNPDPALTHTVVSGLVDGDLANTPDVLAGAVGRAPGETVAGGPYAIDQGALTSPMGYTINFTGNSFTITPRNITVTVDPASKVYGSADVYTYTYGGSGLATGDTLGTAFTGAVNRAPGETVAGGPYAIDQGTLAASTDYTLTQFTGSNLNITPAPLTVTANNAAKAYDSFAYTGGNGITYAGLTNGDLAAGGTVTYAGTSQGAINAGSYTITPGGLTDSNYSITFVNGTLTINSATLTILADTLGKIYGDADPALTYTITAGTLVSGDTLTGSLARAAGENVGSYAINQGSLNNPNYTIINTPANFSITQRSITITADAVTKTYGSADVLTFTVGGSGLATWDTNATAFTGVLNRAVGEDVTTGPYAINQGTLAANANYTSTFTGNVLTITPATLTVAANTSSKILNTADPLLTYTVSGLQFTDTAATALNGGSLVRVAGETVGTYQINEGSLALSLTGSGNYTWNYVSANFTILVPTVIDEIVNTSLLFGPDTGSAQSTSSSEEDKATEDVLADTDIKPVDGTAGQPLPMCN